MTAADLAPAMAPTIAPATAPLPHGSALDDDFRSRAAAQFEADMTALCDELAASPAAADPAMARFLTDFFAALRVKGSQQVVSGMVALPLLTYGAETGRTAPARPLAVIHLLWWAAARYLDDLVDSHQPTSTEADTNKRLITAIGVGSHLPTRVIARIPAPDAVRARLCEEVSRCWLDAMGGQLRDLSDEPLTAAPDTIERSYRGKTGAPYAMATATAACLAETSPDRVAAWHEFGQTFGLLRQFVNDQRDLATGRNEDLRNGTATYLLSVFLRELPAHQRTRATGLLEAAQDSPDARADLSSWMLQDDMIERYADAMLPTVHSAHERLDTLGGEPEYLAGLHALVDETADFFPMFRLLRQN